MRLEAIIDGRSAMTDDQRECFDLFCELVGGEHHITCNVKTWGRGIRASMYSGTLSTFDFNGLTRLVVLCHDRCIRAEIVQSGPGRIGVVLHKRHKREGSVCERHPTMEEAIAMHRPTRKL